MRSWSWHRACIVHPFKCPLMWIVILGQNLSASSTLAISRRGGCARLRSNTALLSSAPLQSQVALSHKVQGPNWTEAEMFVLIGQKCIEWDERHNSNQPSLAKIVIKTTAWKLVLAGCMDVVGSQVRNADQITNKWDGLIKGYNKTQRVH